LAVREILFPRGAEIIETVGGYPAEGRPGVRELATQLELGADAAVARDLRDLESTTQAVAADLEALAVRQNVVRILREAVETQRPALGKASRGAARELRHRE